MATTLWDILQSLQPEQPPRLPVDEFMPPGMGPDVLGWVDQLSQNPALNYSVGMTGPPSMPRGVGPWLKISPRSPYMFEPEALLGNGESIAPGGSAQALSNLIAAIGHSLRGKEPGVGVISAAGQNEQPLADIIDSLLRATTGMSSFGGHSRPTIDALRELGYYPRLPDWAKNLLDIFVTDPNHPSMRN